MTQFVVTGPLSERACLHAPGLTHGDLSGDHTGEEYEPGNNIYLLELETKVHPKVTNHWPSPG